MNVMNRFGIKDCLALFFILDTASCNVTPPLPLHA